MKGTSVKKDVWQIWKNVGETPLEAIERLRAEHPELSHEKLTYAGRLDPMAEGILLVLVGEECKKKEEYLGLDKEYEFEILFGMSTDSLDLLGLINQIESPISKIGQDFIEDSLRELKGKHNLPYPAYSSKTIDGVPLWKLAREGKLVGRDAPINDFEIFEIELLETGAISSEDLLRYIAESIEKVNGDFRQGAILSRWEEMLSIKREFQIATCKARVSSGTYIRQIVEEVGKGLNIPTLALKIKRTKIFL